MNQLKKIVGLLLLVVAPVLVAFLIWQAIDKVSKAAEGVARTNLTLQWGIILFIFLPISIGMMVFGWYALKGEYQQLTENPEDE